MCEVLNITRNVYNYWLRTKEERAKRQKKENELLEEIKAEHKKGKEIFGAKKIYRRLSNRKVECSYYKVLKLKKANGIYSKTRNKFKATTNSNHNLPVAENLLNQDFSVDKANEVWVSDITYVDTEEGWLFLATVLDLFHKQPVGYSMDSTMPKELVITAMQKAIKKKRPGKGLICHSDRGSQYASHDYQRLLKGNGFCCSMSRKGNCYDNACAESFFASLKKEWLHGRRFKTREEAKQAIFEYIESFYIRERPHESLGYLTPLEFEKMFASA